MRLTLYTCGVQSDWYMHKATFFPTQPRLHQELRDNGIRPDYLCPRGV